MMPATKDHTDIGVDNPLTDCRSTEEDPHMARQEFKDEADINYMLSRFGVTPPRHAPVYGEWDDNIDLQTAIESVRQTRAGYRRLPKELRDKFPSMEDFLTAVDNGSLVIKTEDETEAAPPTPPPAPPAPPAPGTPA